MIRTCAQCDSAFRALKLTAPITPKPCVLLYCCACLHPNTILMEAGWSTVPLGCTQGGVWGLNPHLELDILQKLYYKGSVQVLIFYKNKGSACRRICLLCQQTSLENMNMTSNCDVTNSAHQIHMTAICHWMNPPWKFSAYATAVPCAATNLSILICKSSARTKQSVISVALKTPLEIRLGICL